MEKVLFIEKLREAGFTLDQIEKILVIYESLCPHCLDSEKPCYCTYED